MQYPLLWQFLHITYIIIPYASILVWAAHHAPANKEKEINDVQEH